MNCTFPVELDEIIPILPHRPPFLFVDRVLSVTPFKMIEAERTLRADEPFFAGHFPGLPIMPGVLVAEALAQACGLLLAFSEKLSGAPSPLKPKMYYLASTQFKFQQPAHPGDTLRLSAELEANLAGLHRFRGTVSVGPNRIASGSLTLANAETT